MQLIWGGINSIKVFSKIQMEVYFCIHTQERERRGSEKKKERETGAGEKMDLSYNKTKLLLKTRDKLKRLVPGIGYLLWGC